MRLSSLTIPANFLVFRDGRHREILGQQEMVFEFARGTRGHLQIAMEFGITVFSAALGNVRGNRCRTSANLAGQAVSSSRGNFAVPAYDSNAKLWAFCHTSNCRKSLMGVSSGLLITHH